MRTLVVEDEKHLNSMISEAILDEGYSVDSCFNGLEALELCECAEYDVIVLDIMMPKMDGFELVRRLRADGCKTPVVYLTSRDSVSDKVRGLESGGDYYMVKPFDFRELIAVIHVMARKSGDNHSNIYKLADLTLDIAAKQVTRGGKVIDLTGSKFGMHLDKNKIKGIDCSSGSLGHGLSLADGFALAGRVKGQDYMVYCLTGDGELNEGSNWEAAMTAAQFKLSNVVVLVDNNKCMIDGRVDDEMKVEPLDKKFEAFGFKVKRVDGQNMKELNDAIEDAIANHKNGGDQPYCIVMDTFKGAGIDFMEDDYHWHYGALDEAKEKACYESLDKYYKKRCERAEKEG